MSAIINTQPQCWCALNACISILILFTGESLINSDLFAARRPYQCQKTKYVIKIKRMLSTALIKIRKNKHKLIY